MTIVRRKMSSLLMFARILEARNQKRTVTVTKHMHRSRACAGSQSWPTTSHWWVEVPDNIFT